MFTTSSHFAQEFADAFAKATKEIPEEAMYRYRLAAALYESDKIDTAQTEFEEAIKRNAEAVRAAGIEPQ